MNPEPRESDAERVCDRSLGNLDRAADAFWGSLREHLTVEKCEAVEHAGLHEDHWRAAAECAIRAARGERDHRPFTVCPGLPLDPGQVRPDAAAEFENR